MTHTPGPWTAHPDQGINGGPWIEAAKPHTRVHIAHVSNGNEANARLIAAAPEMLDLLALALPYVEDAADNPVFKAGPVKALAKRIRGVIEQVEPRS